MKKNKVVRRVLALLLCLALLAPVPVSAADIYFTSVNDNLLPLTAETMPVWSGGVLYVPYTIFDGSVTGISLGLYCNYSRSSNAVMLFSLSQILAFNLNNNTCMDGISGQQFSAKAIMRNGRPYVPVNTVCSFFGLTASYTAVSQGYLVRVKSGSARLSDARFIDAARNQFNLRLQEYNQSLEPAPEPPPSTPAPSGPQTSSPTTPTPSQPSTGDSQPEVSPTDVRTYLAFRCETGAAAAAALDALEGTGRYAVFFLSPELLEEEGELARRILGTGHSLGLLAGGGKPEETREQLERGNRALERAAYGRTTLVLAPAGQRSGLEDEGWICWDETLSLSPSASVGVNAFASSVLRQLEGRTRPTFLTLGGEHVGRVLPALLRQLSNRSFVVSLPLEIYL